MALLQLAVLMLCLWPGAALAQNGSLFTARTAVGPLIVQPEPSAPRRSPSLFSGSLRASIFAPPRDPAGRQQARPNIKLTPSAAKLLDLIALAEAGPAGYDAVQYGADIRPPRPPSRMSLGEIFDWIEATPGQPHAIGRYQFIPDTLARLVAIKGYGRNTRFTSKVQDQLALILLQDAGLEAFQSKTLPRHAFMKNLARIWAGLPLPNGKSYYQGYAGNKATMSFARFEAGMKRIF